MSMFLSRTSVQEQQVDLKQKLVTDSEPREPQEDSNQNVPIPNMSAQHCSTLGAFPFDCKRLKAMGKGLIVMSSKPRVLVMFGRESRYF
jgi:hypothetical protein